jgi:hypothetical protein
MISATSTSISGNLFSAPIEGVRRGFAQAGDAATKIAQGDVSPGNVVAQIQAEVLVQANAVSMRTADEILGALIDTTA